MALQNEKAAFAGHSRPAVTAHDSMLYLNIPQRPANALPGSAFVDLVRNMNINDRERAVVTEILAGNVPSFSRSLKAITLNKTINDSSYEMIFYALYAFGHDSKGEMYSQSKIKGREAAVAGGLLTTSADYCTFCIDVINGAGLSRHTYNDMISTHAELKDHCAKGLGWEVISDLPGGKYALEHGGNNEGFRSRVILLPKLKRGVIVITNGDNGRSVCNEIIKESIDIAKDIFDYMRCTTRKIIALSYEILERYTGTDVVDS